MLLFIDKLPEKWDGEFRLFDFEDAANMPFALQRLSKPGDLSNYDTSGMGYGSSVYDCEETTDPESIPFSNFTHEAFSKSSLNNVHKLPVHLFHNKLIERFDIMFKSNKIR